VIPNLRHLELVREVARLGGIGVAARSVHLSQPAVTQAVASIERYFGATLFVRSTGGIAITAAAEICLSRIDRALEQLHEGLIEARRGQGLPRAGARQLLHKITNAQLMALIQFVEHGSFASAARASGVAEATFHRTARALERTVAVPLFEHTSFGIRPTRAAQALSRKARLACNEIGQALSDIDALRGRSSGRTVIGAMPLARSYIVPVTLIDFARDHPEHALSIMEGTYEHLLAALRSGEADVLIGALRDRNLAPDVREEHLFDDVLSIVASANHPLRRRGKLQVADLAQFPWIAPRSTSPLHAHFDALFRDAGMEPPPQPVQCNSMVAARAFLLEGNYLMLASTHQIHYELEAGMLTALPHPRGRVVRSIGLTMRRNWQPTLAQNRLLELLRSHARGVGAGNRSRKVRALGSA
jgi:DNA-binding transcriptional LysR family regulator